MTRCEAATFDSIISQGQEKEFSFLNWFSKVTPLKYFHPARLSLISSEMVFENRGVIQWKRSSKD
jgi:hypothetical protein